MGFFLVLYQHFGEGSPGLNATKLEAYNIRLTQNLYSSGRFSNGRLGDDSNDDGAVQFGFFESDELPAGDGRRKRKSMLVAETPTMTYVGQSSGAYAPTANTQCK